MSQNLFIHRSQVVKYHNHNEACSQLVNIFFFGKGGESPPTSQIFAHLYFHQEKLLPIFCAMRFFKALETLEGHLSCFEHFNTLDRVFQIASRDWEVSPTNEGGMGNLLRGVFSVGEDEQIFGLWGRLPLSSQ